MTILSQNNAVLLTKRSYGASRSPGERLGDRTARLRVLASYCDFDTALESNLRDSFVLGFCSGPERDKLFKQNPSTLTLKKALELVEQAEGAKQAKAVLCTDTGHIKEKCRLCGGIGVEDVMRRELNRCLVCGMSNHSSVKCHYKKCKCQKCKIKGHLKKMCVKGKNSYVNHTQPESVAK